MELPFLIFICLLSNFQTLKNHFSILFYASRQKNPLRDQENNFFFFVFKMRLTRLRSRMKLIRMTLCSVVSMFNFIFRPLRFVSANTTAHMHRMQSASPPLDTLHYTHQLGCFNKRGLHLTNIHKHTTPISGFCLLLVVLV